MEFIYFFFLSPSHHQSLRHRDYRFFIFFCNKTHTRHIYRVNRHSEISVPSCLLYNRPEACRMTYCTLYLRTEWFSKSQTISNTKISSTLDFWGFFFVPVSLYYIKSCLWILPRKKKLTRKSLHPIYVTHRSFFTNNIGNDHHRLLANKYTGISHIHTDPRW